ncbi:DUF4291 family protein [Rhizomonospora bruguierae]|uniref:DUF4291 family protein n=1 Tax=Rhizomonospora bruguierae TaxID=1581705 RepID=UPI0035E42413
MQIGLSGEAADRHVDDWSVTITDVTPTVRTIHTLLSYGDEATARALLPVEAPYPLPESIGAAIAASPA